MTFYKNQTEKNELVARPAGAAGRLFKPVLIFEATLGFLAPVEDEVLATAEVWLTTLSRVGVTCRLTFSSFGFEAVLFGRRFCLC